MYGNCIQKLTCLDQEEADAASNSQEKKDNDCQSNSEKNFHLNHSNRFQKNYKRNDSSILMYLAIAIFILSLWRWWCFFRTRGRWLRCLSIEIRFENKLKTHLFYSWDVIHLIIHGFRLVRLIRGHLAGFRHCLN